MPAPSVKNNFNHRAKRWSFTRLTWRSLPWQMLLVIILPLTVLVLAAAFGSQVVHQNAMRSMVGERDERAVRTAAAALEEQINHRLYAVRSLALLADSARVGELPALLAASQFLGLEFDGGLAFFDSTGALQEASGSPALWTALAQPAGDLIARSLSSATVPALASSAFSDPQTGEAIVLALAISPDGRWIAAGAFSVAEMARHTLQDALLDPLLSGEHAADGHIASFVLVDADRRLLYQSGDSSDPTFSTIEIPGVEQALAGKSGALYLTVNRQELVAAYSPVEPLGWALAFQEPWEMVASPTLRLSQLTPLVMAPVLALAILALWFGYRQIIEPLQKLAAQAARLAWGNFDTIQAPVGGIEEIRQLQSELAHMAARLQAAQQSLHGYIGAITAAQEDERLRLARELHDDSIQGLIALKQRAQLFQLDAQNAGETEALREIAVLTEQSIHNLRRQIRALRPIYLEDLGLATALEMLGKETEQAGGLRVVFERHGAEIRLEAHAELALYRIAQEALNNAVRHAQADLVRLSIAFTKQAVVMQIIDNGCGFEAPRNPADFAPSGHYGLLGMYERADLIGAGLELRSAPGRGAQIEVVLPVGGLAEGERNYEPQRHKEH